MCDWLPEDSGGKDMKLGTGFRSRANLEPYHSSLICERWEINSALCKHGDDRRDLRIKCRHPSYPSCMLEELCQGVGQRHRISRQTDNCWPAALAGAFGLPQGWAPASRAWTPWHRSGVQDPQDAFVIFIVISFNFILLSPLS